MKKEFQKNLSDYFDISSFVFNDSLRRAIKSFKVTPA